MTSAELLAGRYRRVAVVGSGAMGRVWHCLDESGGNRAVAVKELHPHLVGDSDHVRRFEREALSAERVRHPNVAAVLGHGRERTPDGMLPYIVMEFVAGRNLAAHVHEFASGTISWRAQVLADIAEALHAAHRQKVVHRDVKPENIMITTEGRAKLTDFGIALADEHLNQRLTAVGYTVGSPAYMSPEQVGGEVVGLATDIYSLGVVGYWLLGGRLPFVGDSVAEAARARMTQDPPELPTTVPVNLRTTIMQALDREPSRRQASAKELATQLRGDLTALHVADPPKEEAPVLNPTLEIVHSDETPVAVHYLVEADPVLDGLVSPRQWGLAIGRRLSEGDDGATRLGVLLTGVAILLGIASGTGLFVLALMVQAAL
ncbi:serine/threonine-protein kinase [Nocardia sp. NPDC057663]|uniref:serine/threonine-protein kinase n=1 Tax=Nocardia sp. NPDC057663 TaxID=3346201 RepID=UPI00366CE723